MKSKARLKITQTIFYSVLTSCFLAAAEPTVTGARPMATGGLCTAGEGVHAALNHPAQTALMRNPALAITAAKPFIQANWHSFSAIAVYPWEKIGVFSVGGYFYGTSFFHRIQISLGYARNLGKGILIGIRVDYSQIYMREYGTKRMYNPHLSLTYQPLKKLKLGLGLHHPIPYSLHKGVHNTIFPNVYLGVTYLPGEKIRAGIEYVQGIMAKPVIKTGIEYDPLTQLSLQTGYCSDGHRVSLGVSCMWKQLEIQTACVWQPTAGFSPGLSFLFHFTPKKVKTYALSAMPNPPPAIPLSHLPK